MVGAAIAGMLASLLFGFMVLSLGANQVATGLALVIFGTGISSLIGTAYVGIAIPSFNSIFPEALAEHPIGKLFFGYSPLVYFMLIMIGAGYARMVSSTRRAPAWCCARSAKTTFPRIRSAIP